MTSPENRLQTDLLAAQYLEALEQHDFEQMDRLWKIAGADAEVEAAFLELHAGLIEEQRQANAVTTSNVAVAVEEHLKSAAIVPLPGTPVTVAQVADEVFRQMAGQMTEESLRINESLRSASEPIPDNLGLSKLSVWAEAKFGSAPTEYWKAFRMIALKLEMRRASESEYQLAARAAPKREGPS